MRFDATLKELLEESPAAWPELVGHPAHTVDVINAEISTVSGAADKVLHIRDKPEWIQHLEFQAGPDSSLPRRTNVYNAVLEDRHGLPVRSGIVLLRREANLGVINGLHEARLAHDDTPYRIFRYDVIRVWELPPERLLRGGLGLMPLAPISAVSRSDLPDVLQEMKRRLRALAPPAHLAKLWTAVYVLMGLRYQQPLIENLLREVMGMEESVTYQAILAKGEARGVTKGGVLEARRLLLLLGERHFGAAPAARAKNAIAALDDLEKLERLALQMNEARSWEDLLSLPPRRGKTKT